MTDSISVILHWNTDYAEIPRKELPNVVEKSYDSVVRALEDWREGTVCFNLTGHTIEYLLQQKPELMDRIEGLVDENVVEILASGYSHPILPLLPLPRLRSQIRTHIEKNETVFGQRPVGCWPPELAISPLVLNELVDVGVKWTVIDYDHFLLAQRFANEANPFESREKTALETLVEAYWSKGIITKFATYRKTASKLNKTMRDQRKSLVRVKVDEETSIRAILCSRSWAIGTQFALSSNVPAVIYSEKKHFNNVLRSPTRHLLLYGSDVEFWGYRGLVDSPPNPASLTSFLEKLRNRGVKTISPTQIPEDEWPEDASFIGTGSWSPDTSLSIWTDSEDNKEYTRRMSEIYDALDKRGWYQELLNKLLPLLRIAENSDSRGWAPKPERKNEAYTAMLKIRKILEHT